MAIEGKIEVVIKSKFDNGGFGFKLSDGTWHNTKERLEESLQPGYTVRFNTYEEGKNTWLKQVKVLEKGAPPAKGGGKGGGGWKKDPVAEAAKEARYAAQAARETEKWDHQQNVVEPRISLAHSRTTAMTLVDLYIKHGALALGAESAAKRKGIIDAAVEQETARLFEQAMSLKGPARPAVVTIADELEAEQAEDLDALENDDLDDDPL